MPASTTVATASGAENILNLNDCYLSLPSTPHCGQHPCKKPSTATVTATLHQVTTNFSTATVIIVITALCVNYLADRSGLLAPPAPKGPALLSSGDIVPSGVVPKPQGPVRRNLHTARPCVMIQMAKLVTNRTSTATQRADGPM